MKKIHFTGICGTLMGNFALYMKEKGYEVKGSDHGIYPPMSDLLNQNEIHIYDGYTKENLTWNPDLIVIGNAMSRGNAEVEEILKKRLNFVSVPELIRNEMIAKNDCIVISGTHGKTTTSSMIAKVFFECGKDPSFIIGGVPEGFSTGFRSGEGGVVILEGDEYDTAFFDKRSKFLHYFPNYLIINNIEFDHADIFNSLDDIILSFQRLVNIVPENGLIIVNGDDANALEAVKFSRAEVVKFGMSENCDYRICNIDRSDSFVAFDLYHNMKLLDSLMLPVCGDYQLYNFTASYIISTLYPLEREEVKKALFRFKNVKRRMDEKGLVNGGIVIEDFAHHPTAVKNVLNEVKRKYPDKKIIACFESRSNTSVRNIFQKEITESLSLADIILIGKINRPERFTDKTILDLNKVKDHLSEIGKEIQVSLDSEEIAKYLNSNMDSDKLCLIMTNGEFGDLITKLKLEK
ncbi:MAG: hypothetical protein JXR48_01810 [Candidatus Delongbacteria bacterium]|nr:hypothetical protein [Candidatus Delongbacteria bacterium]MBN2833680.1 hypothetical protein [Candidatus Delongbacteria bacterium]